MWQIPFFRDRVDTINVTRSHIKFFSFTLQELCMLATIIGQCFFFFKVRLGKCRHALWQNGPKIDNQKFYWKCNRNLLKCKKNIYWYMYIIIKHFSTLQLHGQSLAVSREFKYKNTEQESWSPEWQTKICYFPFARIVQTRQPQLASDSFFEVKLGTLSKSFGAWNDNFLIWDLGF